MGDLLSEVLSLSAAASASEAADQSKKAANAARENLESNGHNPFLIFEDLEFETIDGPGFMGALFGVGSKAKLNEKGRRLSIKRTDISHLRERQDDFGTVYTRVFLHESCQVASSSLDVAGTMESVQAFINKQ